MMNVVNSAVSSKVDAASAGSSTSGKGARSTGDDGFAKTMNSYGDGQSKGSSNSGNAADGSSTSSTNSEGEQAATDTGSANTTGSTGSSVASTSTVDQTAVGQALSDKLLADIPADLPVEDIQLPKDEVASDTAADAKATDVDATTDLLADLQAVIPANTKAQASVVRNTSTDQSKSDETDVDADTDATAADASADDAVTGEMLAILQAVPEASTTPVDQQQQVDGSENKVDTDILAMRASATMQPVQKDAADTATTTTSDSAGSAKASAAATDTAAAVQDALEQNDDGSVDMDLPAVTVTENRRYIGLAPSSNAVSLATAFGSDPDWSAAMEPSAKLSNEALYASTGKVVNTLKIELNPNDLGHVTATMRMVGEELNIHLTVESSKAYKQLLSDSSSMLDNLKAQGYSVDQITVSIASGSSSTSSDKGNDAFANGRQSSDMGQAQQQQQQNGRQGSSYGGSSSDVSGTNTGSSGGSDESSSQGAATGRADARPDHVYL